MSAPKKAPTGQQVEQVSLHKLPPHDLEAEQRLLGSVLVDQDKHPYFWQAVEVLVSGSDVFYRPAHRLIWQAMQAVIDAGLQVDLITLRDELDRQKHLHEVGGPAYLAALSDTVVSPVNIISYATLLQRKYKRRQMLTAGLSIAYDGLNNAGDDETYLEESERLVLSIQEEQSRGWIGLSALAHPCYDELETLSQQSSAVTGIPSGYYDLDAMTTGFQAGDLTILAARPSMGKSALAVCMARHVAKTTCPVGIFSLEMSPKQLYTRLLSMESQVPFQKIRTGKGLTDEEWEKLSKATGVLSSLPLYIDASRSASPLQIRAKTRILQQKYDIGLVIVDYLQLMSIPSNKGNRTEVVSEISRSLKLLAGELDIHVIGLSQLNRAVEQRSDKRPVLSDLRESGSIEQDADTVGFIYRPEMHGIEGMTGMAELLIRKQRNGPLGTVSLLFLKEFTEFVNYSEQAQWQITPQQTEDAWYESKM